MQKKLPITIDEIEKLDRAHVIGHELDTAYAQMAQDREREAEAYEWAEALLVT